jgi:hypothetical protein
MERTEDIECPQDVCDGSGFTRPAEADGDPDPCLCNPRHPENGEPDGSGQDDYQDRRHCHDLD